MSHFDGLLFALDDTADLGDRVAAELGVPRAVHEEREFEGGEHKTRPLVSVRGRDVYVVARLDGDARSTANDKLCRLLFFLGAIRDASARSVTAVAPYLCYSRKDRRTKARDPVTTRYVAQLLEAVGTDRVMTLDVHSPAAFENAVRCRAEHLEATQLFVDHVRDTVGGAEVVVVSPDVGGVKRAERFRSRLEADRGTPVGLAFAAKHRSRGVVSGPDHVLGDVEGRVALVFDDMISSGGTMSRVADMLLGQGASQVRLLATHGLFVPAAAALFETPSVAGVAVTDSVATDRLPAATVADRLTVLSIAPLLAEAIGRVQAGGSLTDLLRLET